MFFYYLLILEGSRCEFLLSVEEWGILSVGTLIVEHFLEEEVLLEMIYGIMEIYWGLGLTYE